MSHRFDRTEPSMTKPIVDEDDVETRFSRAGGPGGQNVNKRSTKADVRVQLSGVDSLTEDQKNLIRDRLRGTKRYLTETDEVITTSRETRYQGQNERIALEKLNEILQEALAIAAERKATKVPRSVDKRRVENKRLAGRAKQEGRGGWDD